MLTMLPVLAPLLLPPVSDHGPSGAPASAPVVSQLGTALEIVPKLIQMRLPSPSSRAALHMTRER